ncbi:MAG: YraN family protein [Eubacteriales bacterium]|nr:YraN family protein [Eubacteriales bacterium]
MDANRQKGRAGEDAALRWYLAQGYALLARNYRALRCEVDLVLRQKERIVFCEVKARSGSGYGSPAEAVTAAKQAHIRTAAQMYLTTHGMQEAPVRFDVAEVSLTSGYVNVIENAF